VKFGVALLLLAPSLARADISDALTGRPITEHAEMPPAYKWSATWPVAVDMHAMIGVEPHDVGVPIAFGVGGELLWKARFGVFAAMLSSEGTPVKVTMVQNGTTAPSLADRISLPFGVAVRPLSFFVPTQGTFLTSLAQGVGVQAGITVENLRTSDDNTWNAGGHLAATFDVPLIWGSPVAGGVALRIELRGLFTAPAQLDHAQPTTPGGPPGPPAVTEPAASFQFFAGICYYP
jgi:hypothetical protein